METLLAESQTDSCFPTKWPNGYPIHKDVSDTHIQSRTITKINQDRRTALKRSVKRISLGGLIRFYVATTLALTAAAVWTHNLFSPHEGFLTHQSNISESTKKQLITEMKQRWGLDRTKQLKCWSKRKPTVRIRLARPKIENQVPTNITQN